MAALERDFLLVRDLGHVERNVILEHRVLKRTYDTHIKSEITASQTSTNVPFLRSIAKPCTTDGGAPVASIYL